MERVTYFLINIDAQLPYRGTIVVPNNPPVDTIARRHFQLLDAKVEEERELMGKAEALAAMPSLSPEQGRELKGFEMLTDPAKNEEAIAFCNGTVTVRSSQRRDSFPLPLNATVMGTRVIDENGDRFLISGVIIRRRGNDDNTEIPTTPTNPPVLAGS